MKKSILTLLLSSLILLCSTPIYSFFNLGQTTDSISGGLLGGLFGGGSRRNDSQYESYSRPKNRYSFKSLKKMDLDQFNRVLALISEHELNEHTKKFEAQLEKYQDEINKYTKKLNKKPDSEKYQKKIREAQSKHDKTKNKLNSLYSILTQVTQSPPSMQPLYGPPIGQPMQYMQPY